MNTTTAPDSYSTLIEPQTLKAERLLPGPIERVWAYLTDSDLRRQWLAAGEMKMQTGSAFEFVWRNDELNCPSSERPAGASEEHRMQSTITELNAPYRIAFTWGESANVTFDLEQKGEKVLLTITHRRLLERPVRLSVSAGWHMHLDVLVACLTEEPVEGFWDGFVRLKAEYDQRLPA